MNFRNIRIGHGLDIHKFSTDRKLILGGIHIPYKYGLIGHSDADVLLHSIIDSILGALNLGDIGQWFPNTNCTYKNQDSSTLLKEIVLKTHMHEKWDLINMDSNIILDSPMITEQYSQRIKVNISKIIDVKTDIISLKSKTTEGIIFNNNEGVIVSTTSLIILY